MRIIENPNPIDEDIVICGKCKCRYAYNKADIHTKSHNNGVLGPGYESYHCEYVNCPNCGKIHIINEKHCPDTSENFMPYIEMDIDPTKSRNY